VVDKILGEMVNFQKVNYQKKISKTLNDQKLLVDAFGKLTIHLNIITGQNFLFFSHEGPRENPNFRSSYLEEFRQFALKQLNLKPTQVMERY
jgi:hypothetical protein